MVPEWLRIGSRADLETGRVRRVIFGRQAVALFVWNGAVCAIGDECPHRGTSLAHGDVSDDGYVACSQHGWEYSLTTGCGRQAFEGRVPTFLVREHSGEIFIADRPARRDAVSNDAALPQTPDAMPTETTSVWNPDQYERFRHERSLPFFDLLSLVEKRPAMRVVDLGCGTGELTRRLHRTLGAQETLGIDNSETMLARSADVAGDGLRFDRDDIAKFPGDRGTFDVVFTNAALQWLPDHTTLFARLRTALAPGGQLAVQMPTNYDHPSHTVAADVAAEEPFRSALGGYVRADDVVLAPEAYASLLFKLGFARQHVRLQVYAHSLDDRTQVIEWVRGTLLTDYEKRLPSDLFASFLARYRERLLPQLEDTRPYFYPFKRVLMWAAL